MTYAIKSPQYSYEKEFERIKEKYNLKGQIKTVSNIACEYIITLGKEFFETVGEEERGLPKEETGRIEKFDDNMHKFINWICKKFSVAEDYNLIRNFEKENNILLDPKEQIKKEDKQKEWDLEL